MSNMDFLQIEDEASVEEIPHDFLLRYLYSGLEKDRQNGLDQFSKLIEDNNTSEVLNIFQTTDSSAYYAYKDTTIVQLCEVIRENPELYSKITSIQSSSDEVNSWVYHFTVYELLLNKKFDELLQYLKYKEQIFLNGFV